MTFRTCEPGPSQKTVHESDDGDKYVQPDEFRELFVNLFYFTKLKFVFNKMDKNHDAKVSVHKIYAVGGGGGFGGGFALYSSERLASWMTLPHVNRGVCVALGMSFTNHGCRSRSRSLPRASYGSVSRWTRTLHWLSSMTSMPTLAATARSTLVSSVHGWPARRSLWIDDRPSGNYSYKFCLSTGRGSQPRRCRVDLLATSFQKGVGGERERESRTEVAVYRHINATSVQRGGAENCR